MFGQFIGMSIMTAVVCNQTYLNPYEYENEIISIDRELELPSGSSQKTSYARYYRLKDIKNDEGLSIGIILEGYFLEGYATPGLYLMDGKDNPPNYSITDGGCRVVRILVNLTSKKVLYNECNPTR